MLVLLPPSESKRAGGSGRLERTSLFRDDSLGEARDQVRVALEELCRGDETVAAKVLKLGVKNRGELAYNRSLDTSGTLPAVERYTGVLYDALGVGSLNERARRWVDDHVYVQSALFGLVSAADAIPAYRLSASSRLPALGAPLKQVWGEAHSKLAWPEEALVLDLRSKDYAALATAPADQVWRLNVVQRDHDGQTRALNHFNKAAKGDLVRRLAERAEAPVDGAELVSLGDELGLEMSIDAASRTLTLVSELGAPVKAH